ncbi:MFS transporter [Bifidobacterium margollesii]|nr:MFS transporter [Bifidobacterium margollesii]
MKQNLGLKDYAGYGIGDMAINFTFASLGMYVVYFYTDVVGVSATIIGTLMLFSRSFDGVIDVCVGSLVDKTSSRWGKTRPWLLFGCVPLAILTALLFAVPANVSDTVKVVYIFVSYNLLMVAFSSIAIPYGTLNSLVTQDQGQREKFNLARMFLAQIGVLIVTNLTLPLVNAFGNKQSSWVWTYAILAAIGVVLLLIVFKTQRERVQQPHKEKIPLSISLKALAQNKYWFLAFGFFVVWSVMYALTQGSLVYYAKYILNDAGYVGVLSIGYLAPCMVMLVVCAKLYEKYGKTRVLLAASVVSIIGYALPMLMPSSFGFIMFTQIVKGIGYGPMLGAVWALFPDTIEYGYAKTGVRNEGLLYSGGSLGQKIGVGVGTALTGWVLGWGGYDGTKAEQSASAINSIYQIYVWIPIALFVVSIVILCFYDIDKKYAEIMEGVARRNAENKEAKEA